MDRHPHLLDVMDRTYWSLTLYSCVVFILLTLFSRQERTKEFLVLFFVSAIVVSVIGLFFPADGTMVFYALEPNTLVNVSPREGTFWIDALHAVRANPDHTFRLNDLPGLAAFPSFHAAMGVITVYCARETPHRWNGQSE
ncbi:phosphatase PAP2 family protein [Microvirga arsenatis]|uniref:Inositolphosphotransferase Aur1/Ipt1 domain-containing protein n=1 Tax=Microvirga arsenatis TaxID=2692265 RepID=A0ABW9YUV2_9HYPH|nr:hypothetical protein [Microvirga arsenatis]NBJ24173.1 hypothetical protein [Microvirga arsenatis]